MCPPITSGPIAAVVDRIVDGEHALLLVGEEEKPLTVSIDLLPPGTEEGHLLRLWLQDGTPHQIKTDPETTQASRARIASKMSRLQTRGRRVDRQ